MKNIWKNFVKLILKGLDLYTDALNSDDKVL